MGNKINPVLFRLGINKECDSVWYSYKNYANFVKNDKDIRDFIKAKYLRAGISKIILKRKNDGIDVTVRAARPGVIIGKGGVGIEEFNSALKKMVSVPNVKVNVVEEKNIDTCSPILGETIARQLEKRVAFRRAMKQVVGRAMRSGIEGIKVQCAGRLGGAEIARTEWYREGRVPLQTIRADIDYSFTEALTVYGKIGIKVWIYKGDIIPQKSEKEEVS
jgi:small subunit ribosomal protein S3